MATTYSYKYFDIKGRGELIRYLFALKGLDYEETLIQFADWPAEKSKTPFGWLPTITFDGKTYSDSMAIATYLAREFGYAGKTNLDMLEAEQVLGICKDAIPVLGGIFFEKDETKKAQQKKEAYEEKLPKFFKALTKILTEKDNGYFAGSELSIADLAVFDLCDHVDADFVDKYPKVKANMEMVGSQDRIKAYKAKRKPVPF